MKRFLTVIVAGGALILLVGAANPHWGSGNGPGMGGRMGPGMMGSGGQGPLGFLNHDLLWVKNDAYSSPSPVTKDLLHHLNAMKEELYGSKDIIVGKGNLREGLDHWADGLKDPAFPWKELLHVPSGHVGKAKQTQRLSRRRTVHDHTVKAPYLDLLFDLEKTAQFLHPRENRHLFRNHIVQTAAREQSSQVFLHLPPVSFDLLKDIDLLRP